MELLLLLTALFASLTGGSADGSGPMRTGGGVAVVRAAETVQAAVQPARRAALPASIAAPAPRLVRRIALARTAAPAAALRLAFEQRRE